MPRRAEYAQIFLTKKTNKMRTNLKHFQANSKMEGIPFFKLGRPLFSPLVAPLW